MRVQGENEYIPRASTIKKHTICDLGIAVLIILHVLLLLLLSM